MNSMMSSYLQNMRKQVGKQCILLPGVRAVILNDRNEVLLQHRRDMDCWGLPAGSVELDETALEALKREVLEETALEVISAEPMALYSGTSQRFTYPNGDEVLCFSLAFVIREWKGSPRADGVEGLEVKFFPLLQLPKNLVAIHAETFNDYERYNGTFFLA